MAHRLQNKATVDNPSVEGNSADHVIFRTDNLMNCSQQYIHYTSNFAPVNGHGCLTVTS